MKERSRDRGITGSSGKAKPSAAAGWVHHIDLTVSDLARATEFYDDVLPLLGFKRGVDAADGPVWAGARVEIGLQRARPSSRGPHDRYSPGLHHLAFGAPDAAAVDGLYRKLLELEVDVLDPPAAYEQYAPGYYAVFFAGPDGVKLEYVYTPVWPEGGTKGALHKRS